jgi:hypothetical protein
VVEWSTVLLNLRSEPTSPVAKGINVLGPILVYATSFISIAWQLRACRPAPGGTAR